MDGYSVVGGAPTAAPRSGARRRSRRWLRVLCLLSGVTAALFATFGLIGVMLFSRFGAAMSGPSWWYGLRPLELAGVAPKGGLWWLGLVGWAVIGLVGLLLMGRAANRQRRPRLISSLVLVALTCVATVTLARALYVRPGKVVAVASLSRLEQLTGIEFPRHSRLVAARLRAGPSMHIRAVVTMPRAAAEQLASPEAEVWPGDASVQTVDTGPVAEMMEETDERWNLPEWTFDQVGSGTAGIAIFGGGDREWQVAFLAGTPSVGDARVLLDFQQ